MWLFVFLGVGFSRFVLGILCGLRVREFVHYVVARGTWCCYGREGFLLSLMLFLCLLFAVYVGGFCVFAVGVRVYMRAVVLLGFGALLSVCIHGFGVRSCGCACACGVCWGVGRYLVVLLVVVCCVRAFAGLWCCV